MKGLISILKFSKAMGWTLCFGGVMAWALNEFGRNVTQSTTPDFFSPKILFLSGSGLLIGVLTSVGLKILRKNNKK